MMTMESPSGYGLVVVVSVSTSVAVLLLHLHKRMASDFINKFEFQILSSNCEKRQGRKKKVRFAEKVIEVPLEEQDVEDCDSRPELEDKTLSSIRPLTPHFVPRSSRSKVRSCSMNSLSNKWRGKEMNLRF